ncbi:MAG TPA: AbrB/MazE/SpoVT family DNA-binding domain-containing protein [Ruminiclostridium sp.]|nr:AbrB/MazE/SpoVT family DNA-binding domain-containing protein [Ruminiclostridium sp.]
MKSTGIVRKIDLLGRIVVPRETRQNLNIDSGDPIEFFYDKDSIYLKKYSRGCEFCNSMEELTNFKGQYICDSCKKELFKAYEEQIGKATDNVD